MTQIFVQQRVGEVKVGWLYDVAHMSYTKVEEVGLVGMAHVVEDVPESIKKAISILIEGE